MPQNLFFMSTKIVSAEVYVFNYSKHPLKPLRMGNPTQISGDAGTKQKVTAFLGAPTKMDTFSVVQMKRKSVSGAFVERQSRIVLLKPCRFSRTYGVWMRFLPFGPERSDLHSAVCRFQDVDINKTR